jgi:Putative prokaryotic signal transducing protein
MTPKDSESKKDRTADDPELAVVFTTIDPTQMRIARDMMESSGMEVFVFDRDSSRMLGTTPGVPIRMMVHRDDADEARKRLKELGFAE